MEINYGYKEEEEEIEYELEIFDFNEFKISVRTVAYMPLTKLLSNHIKEVEISGQKLWCGSLCVIQFFMKNPIIIEDSVVIELGAGTGVLGMCCKKLGAKHIVLTDHDVRSLNHMIGDCDSNQIDAEINYLDWYNPSQPITEVTEITKTRYSDSIYSNNNLTIVAGDVLYKSCLIIPFFTTTKLLLSKKRGSKLYLCHVPRAGINHEDVVSAAKSFNLTIEEIDDNLWRNDLSICLKYSTIEEIQVAKLYVVGSMETSLK
jgi:predicted nicotinamide N-methyase